MRKIGKAVIANVMFLLLLTSCWNSKDIQNMAYVTAVGFDYEDGKYISYVQVLNFSNVARGESTEVGKKVPAWIGRGEGATVTESFNSIYSTSQLRIFWGHVKAIVASERFLKHSVQVKEAYDMINRYREIRYNILIYGTKDPMREIFSQKSVLNLSPLDSILDSPAQTYSQRSYILPVYGFKLVSQIDEPAGSAMLPSLTFDRRAWTEDMEKRSMFRINGAYFFNDGRYSGWMSEQDLLGYRWLQKKLNRSPINIPSNKDPDAAVVLVKPKPHVNHVIHDGKVFFHIRLTLQAYVDELAHNLSKNEVELKSAQVVAEQIKETYLKGIRMKLDVLRLGECLYRENPKKWHELHQSDTFVLDKDSLERIDVKVRLIHTGKYKLRVK